MRTIRERLYFIKAWYKDIFRYPKKVLRLEHNLDYDAYWEKKRGATVGALSDWQRARADIIISQLPKEVSVTIGDIGCGEGSILKYLQEHARIGNAVGYDSSAFVLQKAASIGVHTRMLDMRDAHQLAGIEPADYMLLLEVLEHIPHSEEVLSVAYAKASRGVFFSFPNSGYFIYRLRLLFGRFPKQWINFPNEHLRFWTMTDVRWWLNALGYRTYRMYHYKGIPMLSRLWPSLFAAGQLIFLEKTHAA